MRAQDYANSIAAYLAKNHGQRGLVVYREFSLGKTIIGKNRRLDVFALHEPSGRALAIECKWQGSQGTTDEKIPYALQDLAAMHIPAFMVYAGTGFSPGVLHMLQSHALAAYCLPPSSLEPTPGETTELDHVVAMTFGWWDALVAGRQPFDWTRHVPAPAGSASEPDDADAVESSG
ncbi:MAG TPA: PD-(D/E)XK nuclease superfamily protein [Polyangiaceae bacterium]|nr:PD-(D/E)XK nuclease superfamily protein [Polyangiaceae bacterium]